MKENLCGIYCIENKINKKKYIGLSRNIKRRWSEHRTELKSGTHDNVYLQRAYIKYGAKMFKYYIVELCDESELSNKEKYYIDFYKTMSHENGYNLTVGGENTSIGKPVIDLRDKKVYPLISDAAMHENVSKITIIDWCKKKYKYMYLCEYNQLDDNSKRVLENQDWDLILHNKRSLAHSKINLSDETVVKYKKATEGKNNPRAYKVYCPELDEYFDFVKLASKKYNICYSSITQCINGKLKSAGVHPKTNERLTWIKV